MTIIRWDPMRTMMNWGNTWDDDSYLPTASDNLDVYETKDEVVVKAAIAGVDPDHVEVTFEKGILTITGSEESEEKDDKKFYRKSTRSYSYRVAVPGTLDLSSEPTAEVKNGVIAVSFKKAEEAKPKKISVKR